VVLAQRERVPHGGPGSVSVSSRSGCHPRRRAGRGGRSAVEVRLMARRYPLHAWPSAGARSVEAEVLGGPGARPDVRTMAATRRQSADSPTTIGPPAAWPSHLGGQRHLASRVGSQGHQLFPERSCTGRCRVHLLQHVGQFTRVARVDLRVAIAAHRLPYSGS